MKRVLAGLFSLAILVGPVASAGARGPRSLLPEASALAQKGEKAGAKKRLSDAQVRQLLIDESIDAYSGNCPCPYSTMSNGRQCGRRSAYSRPGGEAPLCYAKDVTLEMVAEYRAANAE